MNEEELKDLLDKTKLPQHIAIIMDGNGRWADRLGVSRNEGHRAGIESVKAAVELCGELKIPILTLYTFSTENWKRPIMEVITLMRLLKEQLRKQTSELNKNNVQLRVIGNIEELPRKIIREIERSITATKDNNGLILNMAINYGSRQEMLRAMRTVINDIRNSKIKADALDENLFAQYLYTKDLPDPDLLIRTSGEMRISNFLLWQLAYSEIYITDVLWPDFRKKDLLIALLDYQRRERRFGAVNINQ